LDTDLLYFEIIGKANEKINQGFKQIITNEQFCNEHVYKWYPSHFYSTNNSNPTFKTEIERMTLTMKLLGYVIEKHSQHMIDLARKMYTAFNNDSIVSLK
jgi:hypothetical protein